MPRTTNPYDQLIAAENAHVTQENIELDNALRQRKKWYKDHWDSLKGISTKVDKIVEQQINLGISEAVHKGQLAAAQAELPSLEETVDHEQKISVALEEREALQQESKKQIADGVRPTDAHYGPWSSHYQYAKGVGVAKKAVNRYESEIGDMMQTSKLKYTLKDDQGNPISLDDGKDPITFEGNINGIMSLPEVYREQAYNQVRQKLKTLYLNTHGVYALNSVELAKVLPTIDAVDGRQFAAFDKILQTKHTETKVLDAVNELQISRGGPGSVKLLFDDLLSFGQLNNANGDALPLGTTGALDKLEEILGEAVLGGHITYDEAIKQYGALETGITPKRKKGESDADYDKRKAKYATLGGYNSTRVLKFEKNLITQVTTRSDDIAKKRKAINEDLVMRGIEAYKNAKDDKERDQALKNLQALEKQFQKQNYTGSEELKLFLYTTGDSAETKIANYQIALKAAENMELTFEHIMNVPQDKKAELLQTLNTQKTILEGQGYTNRQFWERALIGIDKWQAAHTNTTLRAIGQELQDDFKARVNTILAEYQKPDSGFENESLAKQTQAAIKRATAETLEYLKQNKDPGGRYATSTEAGTFGQFTVFQQTQGFEASPNQLRRERAEKWGTISRNIDLNKDEKQRKFLTEGNLITPGELMHLNAYKTDRQNIHPAVKERLKEWVYILGIRDMPNQTAEEILIEKIIKANQVEVTK